MSFAFKQEFINHLEPGSSVLHRACSQILNSKTAGFVFNNFPDYAANQVLNLIVSQFDSLQRNINCIAHFQKCVLGCLKNNACFVGTLIAKSNQSLALPILSVLGQLEVGHVVSSVHFKDVALLDKTRCLVRHQFLLNLH